jgi:hypothetical protein
MRRLALEAVKDFFFIVIAWRDPILICVPTLTWSNHFVQYHLYHMLCIRKILQACGVQDILYFILKKKPNKS